MRRIITLATATLFAIGMMAGPAAAFAPPEESSTPDDLFKCTDFLPAGHPGAAGLVDATPLVHGITAGTSSLPHGFDGGASVTAWNAAFIDNPVGSACD